MNSTEPIPSDWRWGTPEGSREFDRLTDRRLTFREKLEWLEEAETLSLQMRVRPKQIPSGTPDRRKSLILQARVPSPGAFFQEKIRVNS